MASNIDATKPTEGNATTKSVRDNFAAAKAEIEALQTAVTEITPEGWTLATLLNGWSAQSAISIPTRFKKLNSTTVRIEGVVKGGQLNTPIFTLPAGYGPSYVQAFAILAGGILGSLVVDTNGDVMLEFGTTNYVYFALDFSVN